MTIEELEKEIALLPAEEKKRLIEMGRQIGSVDTLAQAQKTLNGLKEHGALLVDHGFSLKDGEKLQTTHDALDLAGVARADTQTNKKVTNKEYVSALTQGKTTRKKAMSILENIKGELTKKPDEVSKKAAHEVAAVLEKVKSVGTDALALAKQLDLLQGALANPTIATVAAERGGPKALSALTATAKDLREVAPEVATPLGTPGATERMDLLDGIIIEITRNARRAARSAAVEAGQDSIAKAFELTSLYRAATQSKDAKEKAALVFKSLVDRGLSVSKELQEKILATREIAVLDRWLAKVGAVSSAESLFS